MAWNEGKHLPQDMYATHVVKHMAVTCWHAQNEG